MEQARYVGHTILFGKPYCWVRLADGKLSLISDLWTLSLRPAATAGSRPPAGT